MEIDSRDINDQNLKKKKKKPKFKKSKICI